MTEKKFKVRGINLQEVFGEERDGLREILREVFQEVLEAEMCGALGAEKGERNPERPGYRSGHYARFLMTRVGKLELQFTELDVHNYTHPGYAPVHSPFVAQPRQARRTEGF